MIVYDSIGEPLSTEELAVRSSVARATIEQNKIEHFRATVNRLRYESLAQRDFDVAYDGSNQSIEIIFAPGARVKESHLETLSNAVGLESGCTVTVRNEEQEHTSLALRGVQIVLPKTRLSCVEREAFFENSNDFHAAAHRLNYFAKRDDPPLEDAVIEICDEIECVFNEEESARNLQVDFDSSSITISLENKITCLGDRWFYRAAQKASEIAQKKGVLLSIQFKSTPESVFQHITEKYGSPCGLVSLPEVDNDENVIRIKKLDTFGVSSDALTKSLQSDVGYQVEVESLSHYDSFGRTAEQFDPNHEWRGFSVHDIEIELQRVQNVLLSSSYAAGLKASVSIKGSFLQIETPLAALQDPLKTLFFDKLRQELDIISLPIVMKTTDPSRTSAVDITACLMEVVKRIQVVDCEVVVVDKAIQCVYAATLEQEGSIEVLKLAVESLLQIYPDIDIKLVQRELSQIELISEIDAVIQSNTQWRLRTFEDKIRLEFAEDVDTLEVVSKIKSTVGIDVEAVVSNEFNDVSVLYVAPDREWSARSSYDFQLAVNSLVNQLWSELEVGENDVELAGSFIVVHIPNRKWPRQYLANLDKEFERFPIGIQFVADRESAGLFDGQKDALIERSLTEGQYFRNSRISGGKLHVELFDTRSRYGCVDTKPMTLVAACLAQDVVYSTSDVPSNIRELFDRSTELFRKLLARSLKESGRVDRVGFLAAHELLYRRAEEMIECEPMAHFSDTRRDLSSLRFFAIDSDRAIAEDAIAIEELNDGSCRITIAYTDPSSVIYPGSLAERAYRLKGRTHFSDKTQGVDTLDQDLVIDHLLPVQKGISCKFSKTDARDAVVFQIRMKYNSTTTRFEPVQESQDVFRARIKLTAQYSYAEVEGDERPYAEYNKAYKLAEDLRAYSQTEGSFNPNKTNALADEVGRTIVTQFGFRANKIASDRIAKKIEEDNTSTAAIWMVQEGPDENERGAIFRSGRSKHHPASEEEIALGATGFRRYLGRLADIGMIGTVDRVLYDRFDPVSMSTEPGQIYFHAGHPFLRVSPNVRNAVSFYNLQTLLCILDGKPGLSPSEMKRRLESYDATMTTSKQRIEELALIEATMRGQGISSTVSL